MTVAYGNTIKKAAHVKWAYEQGIRLFATDSKADLQNIAEYAPGSKIFVRILVEGGETAEWPLSRKFGCHPDMAIDLLVQAKNQGLIPYGISFHVGSQQKDIAVFTRQLATMMKAGVPLLQCFDIVGKGHSNAAVAKLLMDIKADVETGSSLSAAFRKYPLHFDALFCNLIAAGEQAGILDTLLDRLATYKEKILAIKAKIKSAFLASSLDWISPCAT